MTIDSSYLFSALLSYNYLPMVKEHRDETPSLFSTESLTPEIADELVVAFNNLPRKSARKRNGFDQVEYRTTRFNNVIRKMNIPVPMAYCSLCQQLRDSWDQPELNRICSNPSSKIKPERHGDGRLFLSENYEVRDTGRVVVMGKDEAVVESESLLASSLGMQYFVEADVSACFPSIYTHAIPWALIGHSEAKLKIDEHASWFNQIDKRQRVLKRNETLGVPVGPATSNIVCEIVLYPVDKNLRSKGFVFNRYIDDYRAYCRTMEKAEEFVRELESELAKYLLTLNAKKLRIETLPMPMVSQWVLELRSRLPVKKSLSEREVLDYMDYAVSINRLEPDGSVLKYAARSLVKMVTEKSSSTLAKYLVNLSIYSPVLLPILCEVIKKHELKLKVADLSKLLARHLEFRRSDAVGWTLYLYYLSGAKVSKEDARKIISSNDCMPMAGLLAIGQHFDLVDSFVSSVNNSFYQELDQYWILIYELYILNELSKSKQLDKYIEESGFEIMRKNGVSFLSTTEWEES